MAPVLGKNQYSGAVSAGEPFTPVFDPTYAYFSPRGGRVPAPSKGLPTAANIEKLAAVWIHQQSRLWPPLVRARVVPPLSAKALADLARGFTESFLHRSINPFVPSLSSQVWTALGVAYARYSSAMQNPRSLDDQLHQILEWAARERIFIPFEYVFADAEVTGTVASRTGYQLATRVLELERAGSVGTILVDEIDRASRDGLQILSLGNLIMERGKRLVGVTNGFDSRSEQSRTMLYVFAMFNDQFMRQHRDKVIRGRRGALRRKMVIRPLPFGLKHTRLLDSNGNPIINTRGGTAKTAVVDPEYGWVIHLLGDLYVDRGYSIKQITREFNRRNIGDRCNWNESTIHRMLSNHRYIGIFIEGRKRNVKDPKTGKQKFVLQPRSEWSVTRIRSAQIWSWKRWKQIQVRFEECSYMRFGPRAAAEQHRVDSYPTTLFTGILHCGYCRRPLRLARGGEKHSMFCRNGASGRLGCQLRSSKAASVLSLFCLNTSTDTR